MMRDKISIRFLFKCMLTLAPIMMVTLLNRITSKQKKKPKKLKKKLKRPRKKLRKLRMKLKKLNGSMSKL